MLQIENFKPKVTMQSSAKSFSIALFSFLTIPLLYLSNYYNQIFFIYLLLVSAIALAIGLVGKYKKFRSLKISRQSYHFSSATYEDAKRIGDKSWEKFSNKSLSR